MTLGEIVEVGPRDGLQNEATTLSTEVKVDLITRLVDAGVRRIEVASFVHPDRVPQMADAEAVCAALPQRDDVSYIGLVLNRRGLDRALATSIDEINFVVGATDGFNQANQGKPASETMAEIEEMIGEVGDLRTTLTISVAFGCPYDVAVDPDRVVELAHRGAAAGIGEIALGDTIGVAVPAEVASLVSRLGKAVDVPVRGHFHDTRNTAIANCWAAIGAGVTALDASTGGAGGCPFAPDATGNVATEDLLYLLESSGLESGIDHGRIIDTSNWLWEQLGTEPVGALTRAGWFSREVRS